MYIYIYIYIVGIDISIIIVIVLLVNIAKCYPYLNFLYECNVMYVVHVS